MTMEQTLTRLRELRLTGMADALEEQRGIPDVQGLTFEDRLALLVEREATMREDRPLTRLLRQARLRLPASVEGIDFRSPRGLDRSVVLRLAGCDWIRGHRDREDLPRLRPGPGGVQSRPLQPVLPPLTTPR